jgi:hypothetical protein
MSDAPRPDTPTRLEDAVQAIVEWESRIRAEQAANARTRLDVLQKIEALSKVLGAVQGAAPTAPQPTPIPPLRPFSLLRVGAIVRRWWQPALIAALASALVASRAGVLIPRPWTPESDLIKSARAYGRERITIYADCLEAAAKSIRNGGKVADARTRLKQDLPDAEDATFAKRFTDAQKAILESGKEPETAAQRASYADLLSTIAQGVRHPK